MTTYAPQHEEITGASLTGSDGTTSRTYTLANANSISAHFQLIVEGSILQNTTHFTKSGSLITFLINVYNTQPITIDYFTTDSASLSSTTLYCTPDDVRRLLGITSTDLSDADAEFLIIFAMSEIDALTNTTYLVVQDSGTASAGGSTSLTDSTKSWSTDQWASDANLVGGYLVYIYSGTGSGQYRVITANTGTVLTVSPAWTTNPTTSSKYRIFPNNHNNETFTGDNTDTYYTRKQPVFAIQSLTIDGDAITVSTMYNEFHLGKLQLGTSSEQTVFRSRNPLLCNLKYAHGVYPLPTLIRSMTATLAAIEAGNYMMGSTVTFATSYSLPDFQIHKGEPYPQFNRIIETLEKKRKIMEDQLLPRFKRPLIL